MTLPVQGWLCERGGRWYRRKCHRVGKKQFPNYTLNNDRFSYYSFDRFLIAKRVGGFGNYHIALVEKYTIRKL